ncbi:MAG: Fe-S cluster assembly protein SufD [Gammaproteobacteria bacterium]|nr:Fe-S cluster assembly protein SufD [Gammaproteobacteria bacterium]
MSNRVPDTTEKYIEAMRARDDAAREVSWLRALRQTAAARFAEAGFPGLRDEDWKYTDIRPIERAAFMPLPADAAPPVLASSRRFLIEGLSGPRLVFINGRFSTVLSLVDGLPSGVTIIPFGEALRRKSQVLAAHLGRHAPADGHGFAALNTALLTDGAYIHIGAGVRLEQPVIVLYLATANAALLLPRTLVIAEPDSQVTIIEHYAAAADVTYFTDGLSEIAASANAVVEHYRVQEESRTAFHISGVHLQVGRSSRVSTHALDLGGRLVRNDVRAVLAEAGGECHLNGFYLATDKQHVDNHTCIDHAQASCKSREFYRGVLSGRGRTVFRGRIVVRADAQKSDARQVNNNLLLSRDAEADSLPQLEIYADDVLCSHGATVGQLDGDALFYLRSRALDDADARDLLTFAFAREVLDRIRIAPVQAWVERRISAALRLGVAGGMGV